MEKQKNGISKGLECFWAIIIGVFSGFVNGLFGGGGGMIVVPLLCYLLKREGKESHATAILIILPLSLISSIFYAIFGKFNFSIGVPVSIGVVCGGVVGALLLSKLKAKWISIIFSVVMLFAGVKMLFF